MCWDRGLNSSWLLRMSVRGMQMCRTGCIRVRLREFHIWIVWVDLWMPWNNSFIWASRSFAFQTFEISIARFRKPGDHGCVSTTLDPWLCVAVFQQVCDLSVRFGFKVQIKAGLACARPADETQLCDLRRSGDHGCVSTTLDPWLCVAVFQQVCDLSDIFLLTV